MLNCERMQPFMILHSLIRLTNMFALSYLSLTGSEEAMAMVTTAAMKAFLDKDPTNLSVAWDMVRT